MVVNSTVPVGEDSEEEEENEDEPKEWDPLGKYVNAVYKPQESAKKDSSKSVKLDWVAKAKGNETYLVLMNQSGRTINKGEEVTRCYGRRSNATLLVYYSFAYVGNQYDNYEISLEMRPLGTSLTDLVCFDHSRCEGIQ